MRFRLHKGGLEEAMATQTTIDTKEELLAEIRGSFEHFGRKVSEELIFKPVGFDARTGWNTHYVLFHYEGDETYYVAGMSDGGLE